MLYVANGIRLMVRVRGRKRPEQTHGNSERCQDRPSPCWPPAGPQTLHDVGNWDGCHRGMVGYTVGLSQCLNCLKLKLFVVALSHK